MHLGSYQKDINNLTQSLLLNTSLHSVLARMWREGPLNCAEATFSECDFLGDTFKSPRWQAMQFAPGPEGTIHYKSVSHFAIIASLK